MLAGNLLMCISFINVLNFINVLDENTFEWSSLTELLLIYTNFDSLYKFQNWFLTRTTVGSVAVLHKLHKHILIHGDHKKQHWQRRTILIDYCFPLSLHLSWSTWYRPQSSCCNKWHLHLNIVGKNLSGHAKLFLEDIQTFTTKINYN